MQPEIPQVNVAAGASPEVAQVDMSNKNNAAPVTQQVATDETVNNGAQHEQVAKTAKPEISIQALQELMQKPFELANAQGKYAGKPAIGSSLMYINSELAEAHDAFASERHANNDDIEQCKRFLAEGKTEQFTKYFKAFVKSTFEDEMADIILMALSIAGYYGVNIAEHVMLKHRYNELRQEHSAITTRG